MSGYHEVPDAFAEISDLNPYVVKERISGPSTNYHYRFWIYTCQEELHEKS